MNASWRSALAVVLAAGILALAGPGPVQAQSAATGSAGGQSAGAAAASTAPGAPGAPADGALHSERFKKLAEELRCLVCQNQTLADSNAGLAADLRNEVEAQIVQGKTDDEIKTYLVERYGDFVLYRPPVQGNTLLLWIGPFALLVLGAVVWLLVQRRSRARRLEAAPAGEVDRERARQMLD